MGSENGPAPYHLADGAVYKQPIKPDVSFANTASANTVERAAEKVAAVHSGLLGAALTSALPGPAAAFSGRLRAGTATSIFLR